MPCPDELTLDLWLAGALPPDEAAAVADHVRSCAACATAVESARTFGSTMNASLALDAGELAYASSLDLAAPWRAKSATAAWSWLALAAVVAGYLVWVAGAPVLVPLALAAAEIAVGLAPLYLAAAFLYDLGRALVDVARHPVLPLAEPLLAAIAIAALLWPRQLTAQRSTHA